MYAEKDDDFPDASSWETPESGKSGQNGETAAGWQVSYATLRD
jgi:hypothetical protein